MLRVLLKLVVMQPQLLLTHIQNYAELVSEGVQHAVTAWKWRLFLYALAAACLALGLASSAVALLLWAALPVLNTEHAWVLVALPVLLLMAGAACFLGAKRHASDPVFEDIQQQLKLDMLTICQSPAK